MKLGQIIKNILQELSEKKWEPIKIYGIYCIGLQITIHPKYIRYVGDFFRIAINYLTQNNPDYKRINACVTDEIFFSLLLVSKSSDSVCAFILKDIEKAMMICAEELSKNWIKSDVPIHQFVMHEELMKRFGNELVVFEKNSNPAPWPDNILHYLKNEYEYLSELYIRTSIYMNLTQEKIFLVDKEENIIKFIANIKSDLSPAYYAPQPKVTHTEENTLKKLCIQTISRHSLFYPEDCSLQLLSSKEFNLPEDLLKEIEESPMEHIEDIESMTKFKDKIIIFKTSSHYLNNSDGYLIYPNRKDLKVCFVDIDEISILIHKDAVACTHRLSISTLKYANFKARLPMKSELDIIKQSICDKKAKFEWIYHKKEVIDMINKQQQAEDETKLLLKFK